MTAETLLVEDLVLTNSFLIKGKVEGKFSRLSHVLDNYTKAYLVIAPALMIDLRSGDQIKTPRVHVSMDEVVLAHELVDGAGDYFQKMLGEEPGVDGRVQIRAFFHGAVSLELTGWVRPHAYELNSFDRSFFIMTDFTLRGLDMSVSSDFDLVSKLPYAIVHKNKIAYLYDFS